MEINCGDEATAFRAITYENILVAFIVLPLGAGLAVVVYGLEILKALKRKNQ